MNSFPDPLTTPFNDEMHHRDIDELSLSNLSDNSSTTSNDHDLDSATFFEGPEKTLEVQFTPTTPTTLGLRSLSRKILDKICLRARCTIISKVSNAYLDAYVLSESSLFIYPFMLVLKTCGTTTLLRCVKTLLQFACNPKTCEGNLVVEWVGYSRKNFSFPEVSERSEAKRNETKKNRGPVPAPTTWTGTKTGTTGNRVNNKTNIFNSFDSLGSFRFVSFRSSFIKNDCAQSRLIFPLGLSV